MSEALEKKENKLSIDKRLINANKALNAYAMFIASMLEKYKSIIYKNKK